MALYTPETYLTFTAVSDIISIYLSKYRWKVTMQKVYTLFSLTSLVLILLLFTGIAYSEQYVIVDRGGGGGKTAIDSPELGLMLTIPTLKLNIMGKV